MCGGHLQLLGLIRNLHLVAGILTLLKSQNNSPTVNPSGPDLQANRRFQSGDP
jgi:hypothetical protein